MSAEAPRLIHLKMVKKETPLDIERAERAKEVVKEKPFYRRSEFWVSLVTSLAGVFAANHSTDENMKTIGGIAASAAPLVYTFGRAQIKKSVVTGVLAAFAKAVQAEDDKKGE